MSTKFKVVFTIAAVAALFASATAMADYRDYNDKAWNSIYKRSHSVATARSYRSTAPAMQSESAPVEVAQTPTQERTYSYEPTNQSGSASGCTSNNTSDTSDEATAAAQSTQSRRSFSYEPTTNGPIAGRGYSTGRSTSRGEFSIDVGRRAKGY